MVMEKCTPSDESQGYYDTVPSGRRLPFCTEEKSEQQLSGSAQMTRKGKRIQTGDLSPGTKNGDGKKVHPAINRRAIMMLSLQDAAFHSALKKRSNNNY